MIGLDANLLLRMIVNDEPQQRVRAETLIEAECSRDNPGFVNSVTLCEIVWTLKVSYGFDRRAIANAVSDLLASTDVRLEWEREVAAALEVYARSGVDFADLLVAEINRARGCSATATFDRKAAKLAGFMGVK
jgi:predicted nucleic-acid-binding protein